MSKFLEISLDRAAAKASPWHVRVDAMLESINEMDHLLERGRANSITSVISAFMAIAQNQDEQLVPRAGALAGISKMMGDWAHAVTHAPGGSAPMVENTVFSRLVKAAPDVDSIMSDLLDIADDEQRNPSAVREWAYHAYLTTSNVAAEILERAAEDAHALTVAVLKKQFPTVEWTANNQRVEARAFKDILRLSR